MEEHLVLITSASKNGENCKHQRVPTTTKLKKGGAELQCFDFFSLNHLWELSILRHSMTRTLLKLGEFYTTKGNILIGLEFGTISLDSPQLQIKN